MSAQCNAISFDAIRSRLVSSDLVSPNLIQYNLIIHKPLLHGTSAYFGSQSLARRLYSFHPRLSTSESGPLVLFFSIPKLFATNNLVTASLRSLNKPWRSGMSAAAALQAYTPSSVLHGSLAKRRKPRRPKFLEDPTK